MKIKTIFKAIFFNEEAINEISKTSDIRYGLLALLISTLILIVPTELQFSFKILFQNFLVVFAGLLLTSSIVFVIAKFMGTQIDYERFISSVKIILASSLILISVPVLLFVNILFNIKDLSAVLFSLIPYYNFVIFGYSCEIISGFRKFKAILFALMSMLLIFVFYYVLQYITI